MEQTNRRCFRQLWSYIRVEKGHTVCSLHFRGKRKLGGNNIPTIFPDKDCTDEITWVDIDSGDTKDMAELNNNSDVSIKDEEMMPLVDDELTKIKNENERL